MPEKRLHNVLAKKIPPEERNVYRAHAGEYIEQHGGDDGERVAVGEEARYAVSLTDEGAQAFRQASNLLELEEAATDVAYGRVYRGVDKDALEIHNVLGLGGDTDGEGVLVMVADTGYPGPERTFSGWVRQRLVEKWTWFDDGGLDRHGHGSWCLGAAIPGGAKAISAKVLGDNGSGANSNGIAALYRFARLCRDRKKKGVASLSLGSNSESNAYRDAVDFCFDNGVVVVAAAGNDGRRNGVSIPGKYAISCGAMDRRGNAAGFSNRNASHSLPDSYGLGVEVNGIGGIKSGTSMYTPILARSMAIALSSEAGMDVGKARHLARVHNGASRVLDAARLVRLVPKRERGGAPEPPPPSPAGLFSHESLREEE